MLCSSVASFLAFALVGGASHAFAATAEQWKERTIYQIITDRFALPTSIDQSTSCNVTDQTFCGGTWSGITAMLDYITSMGFTAIWISPVHKNYDGPRTAYGDAYHGYWVTDIGALNDRFGTADDLKTLVAEVHRRGMLIMVDIVVNHVASVTTTPTDYSQYYFKDASKYHPYCPIQYGDGHSEQQCWMGDTKVALMDVNTENPDVVSSYNSWIKDFVHEYSIDGLRLDAAKHIRGDFWPGFCQSGGVFCMGEVYEFEAASAARWQYNPVQPSAVSSATGGSGSDPVGMDSILNFPLYNALVQAFGITGQSTDGTLDLTVLERKVNDMNGAFADVGVLGIFLENHDVPRWSNISVDPQSLYNALTFLWMTDGIPIAYYGIEQGFHGGPDPSNREALWPSSYANTTTVQILTKLNQLRNWMIITAKQRLSKRVEEGIAWQDNEKVYKTHHQETTFSKEADVRSSYISTPPVIVGATKEAMAITRGGVIGVVTNIGSPPQNISFPVLTPYERSVATTDIFSCVQYAVGSDGIVSVEYSKGGRPIILVPSVWLPGSGFCGFKADSNALIGVETDGAYKCGVSVVNLGLLVLLMLVM